MAAGLVYLPGVSTLALDAERCTGCGTCLEVCPHAVFARAAAGAGAGATAGAARSAAVGAEAGAAVGAETRATARRVSIVALDRCIECGACALNCPEAALRVDPGVGCAEAILKGWLGRTAPACGSRSEGAPSCGTPPPGTAAAGGKPC